MASAVFLSKMCTKYDTYLATAIELAYQAGEIAQQANKSQLEIRHKRDSSPVTSVDKQLNNFICSVLEKKFPKVRVVGEETSHDHNANEPFEKGLCFFVDPIDGTKNYIRNNGDWCIMIGLVNKGIPVMGVVYHPEKDTMYYAAKGKGAFCIEKKGTKPRRLKAIDTDPIDSICVLSPSDRDDRTVQLANTLGIKQFSDIGSLGLKCCLLADGKANLYVNFKVCNMFEKLIFSET